MPVRAGFHNTAIGPHPLPLDLRESVRIGNFEVDSLVIFPSSHTYITPINLVPQVDREQFQQAQQAGANLSSDFAPPIRRAGTAAAPSPASWPVFHQTVLANVFDQRTAVNFAAQQEAGTDCFAPGPLDGEPRDEYHAWVGAEIQGRQDQWRELVDGIANHNIAEIRRWQREALQEPIPDFCEFVPDPANLHSTAESTRARQNLAARGFNPCDLNFPGAPPYLLQPSTYH